MSYDFFAEYYDALTDNVEYEKRADYFCRLLSLCEINGGILLDLACGTGSLSVELAKRGFDVIGVDSSVGMLSAARQKSPQSILYLCQDMRELDLYGTVDSAICALDSLNHLPDESSVLKAMKSVSLFLNPGGAFVFDVNTPYKHKEVLGDNAFIFDFDSVFCAWQNSYNSADCSVNITLDFFSHGKDDEYYRSGESFTERAYGNDVIRRLLDEAGFDTVAVYDDMTTEPVRENSERAVFLAKKR